MKRFLALITLFISISCYANDYKILKLTPSPVVIGGKVKSAQDTFTDQEKINWKYDRQGMWVQDLTEGGYRYFSKEAFTQAQANNVYSYLKNNHPSTRKVLEWLPHTEAAYDSGKRIALVIGNANYEFEQSLRNPIPDVTDISDRLRTLGFDVLRLYDADNEAIDKALKKFRNTATRQGYGTVLFYYAGHGQQYKGHTYLVPVEANISTEYDITNGCMPGMRVISFINDINATTNIVMIDACRSEQTLLRGGVEDLHMEAPDNGIILFSTKSGEPALDGDGIHSPFADTFLDEMKVDNISLNEMVTHIIRSVNVKTKGTQVPNYMSSLGNTFYFKYKKSSTQPSASSSTAHEVRDNSSYTVTSQPAINATSGTINGHEYVDLGLSVAWATCNIGANKPVEYGDYFAWGETQTKKSFTVDNSKHCKYNNESGWSITKYNIDNFGKKDFATLEPNDDAAHIQWGHPWRMPTDSEFEELSDNCTWEWTTIEGVNGFLIRSKINGNSIFLPAAGYYSSEPQEPGSKGDYWSSSFHKEHAIWANYLAFQKKRLSIWPLDRYIGMTIRPVSQIYNNQDKHIRQDIAIERDDNIISESNFHNPNTPHNYVDLGLSVKWAECNIGAETPEDYGDYFAWGETRPKSSYNWENLKYRASGDKYDNVKFSKYDGSRKYRNVDNRNRLELSDDAARVNWGGSWRMPTRAEQDELREQCAWQWTTQNGHRGFKVTSRKNGNSIFLPAAGSMPASIFVGSIGEYWSSTLGTNDSYFAYSLGFDSSGAGWYGSDRCYGRSVRPVSE